MQNLQLIVTYRELDDVVSESSFFRTTRFLKPYSLTKKLGFLLACHSQNEVLDHVPDISTDKQMVEDIHSVF